MDGYIDLGKIPVAGYLNADPPGEPQFALTAAGSGFANTIQQAGGEVTVDNLGGIGLLASSGSQMGIDTLANIFLTTVSSGTIEIETFGGGNDVNITNAGTIAFDNFGAGAITGVQTINGAVYPPAGGGGTSITQAGALVACLGNGAITISSIGVGADVEVYNAGTIRFDTFGAGAISGLSTVNGVAYPPAFSVPSALTVSTLTAGNYVSTVALEGVSSINGSVFPAPGYVLPADITVSTLTAASYVSTLSLEGVSSINGSVFPAPAYELPADITVSTLTAASYVSTLGLEGVSTINGSAYPPSFVIPADITVSTLTAGVSISTLTVEGVSSITNVGNELSVSALTTNVFGSSSATLGDGAGAGFQISAGQSKVIGLNGLVIEGNLSVSTITDVSTINGSAYPPTFELPADPSFSTVTLANGGYLATTDSTGYIESGTFQGLAGTDTNLYAASDQTLYITGGASATDKSLITLNTDGSILMNNTSIGGLTNGAGLNVTVEGVSLQFPLDPTSAFGVGEISNLSTINGSAYPAIPTSIGDIATGGFVSATTTDVTMGVSATALSIDSGNALTVGSVTANTSIVYASTIQASGDGLNIFETTAGANVKLDTAGKVKINEGLSTITDGTGLLVGTEGYTLTFPLDSTASFNVGEIVNLSTINGVEYPPPPSADPTVSTLTAASFVSTLALEGVSSINGSVFPGSVGWTSTLGSGGFTSTINGADITSPSIVFSAITFPLAGNYTIYQKVSAVKTAGGAGQDLHINALYGDGVIDVNDTFEGLASVPYIDNTSVSTLTTMTANCFVSTIGDTKSIYLFDQSAHTYTADIVAANPVIQYNPLI